MAKQIDFDFQTHEPFAKTQTDWGTEEEVPTPKDLPKVCGWQLLIRPVKMKEKTKGGVIIPGRAKAEIEAFTNIGEVIAVGHMAYKDERFGGTPWCKVGDFVVYHRHAAQRIKWKGVKMGLVADDKIMLVIQDPAALDVTDDMADLSD